MVYVVALGAAVESDPIVLNGLRICASDLQHFFIATDITGLQGAFAAIITDIKKTRIVQ